MLHDDPLPRLEAVEGPLRARQDLVVASTLDGQRDSGSRIVRHGAVIPPIQGEARLRRQPFGQSRPLEERVVMDTARDGLADMEDTATLPSDAQLRLECVALTFAGVPAPLGASRWTASCLLRRISDHVCEVRTALHEFLPGADSLDAGREPTAERQPQAWIGCLLNERFEPRL